MAYMVLNILEIKLKSGIEGNIEERMDALEVFVQNLFMKAELSERFGERANFSISQDSVKTLSSTFAALEEGIYTLLLV